MSEKETPKTPEEIAEGLVSRYGTDKDSMYAQDLCNDIAQALTSYGNRRAAEEYERGRQDQLEIQHREIDKYQKAMMDNATQVNISRSEKRNFAADELIAFARGPQGGLSERVFKALEARAKQLREGK